MTQQNTLLQITRYGMGDGDKELALKLITNYFKLLIEDNRWPKIITFYNEGVKLLTDDHAVVAHLKILEEKGVKLMACTTCLEHYGIAKKIAVGIKGTMMDIITLQANADKVINL
ncbi:MAG: DsrE family protein [Schleiferiaceae bacterium]|jgi:selenium metabolism protein YedF|nr:DsrE family protein [Schleiferiaceae bacterium]